MKSPTDSLSTSLLHYPYLKSLFPRYPRTHFHFTSMAHTPCLRLLPSTRFSSAALPNVRCYRLSTSNVDTSSRYAHETQDPPFQDFLCRDVLIRWILSFVCVPYVRSRTFFFFLTTFSCLFYVSTPFYFLLFFFCLSVLPIVFTLFTSA